MTSHDHYSEYSRRMHKVLEYIDQHLDQVLELSVLAEVAHFSSFHFHRLFSAWMGETMGDYLRRRRLEVAAFRLIAQPETPVLDIALSVGFGSTEAFARAFKNRFGCTATVWRLSEAERRMTPREATHSPQHWRTSRLNHEVSKPDQAHQVKQSNHKGSQQLPLETAMIVKVCHLQSAKVAYFRHIGPYGPSLTEFWGEKVYPWIEANALLGQARYGIGHDDPYITAAGKCRYDACVEIPPEFVSIDKDKFFSTTLPGGRYAVTRFQGPVTAIGEAWEALLRDWLPASGMQIDARPFFEYYPRSATFSSKVERLDCDLCIPIIPL